MMKNARAFKLALEAYNCGLTEGEAHCMKASNVGEYHRITQADFLKMEADLARTEQRRMENYLLARRYGLALEKLAQSVNICADDLNVILEALNDKQV